MTSEFKKTTADTNHDAKNENDVTTVTCAVPMTLERSEAMRILKRNQTGWLWMWVIPVFVFLLWLCLYLFTQCMRGGMYEECTDSRVHWPGRTDYDAGPSGGLKLQPDSWRMKNMGSLLSSTHIRPHTLEDYEQQVTENYLRIQLALGSSSGSLAPRAGPPLLDVGTLKDLRTFQPLLTPGEKAQLLYVFHLFSAACIKHSLPFFLIDTSLLGSLRHHGVIPWSDVSIKVAMAAEDSRRIVDVLDGGRVEGVTLMWSNPYSWTLRLSDIPPDPPRVSRNTFVKIHFYHQNRTHLWVPTWGDKRLFTVSLKDVFPLAHRPFENSLVPVPHSFSPVLGKDALYECRAVLEDEEEMIFRDAGLVSCDVLSQVFPFVTRRFPGASRSTLERVFVNETLLYSVFVEDDVDHAEF